MAKRRRIPEENNYYVYALTKAPTGKDRVDPSQIFYVGKGKGLRWAQHFREAEKAIQSTEKDPTLTLTRKFEAIRDLNLDLSNASTGRHDAFEDHAYIVATGLSQDEAYRLEALTISLLTQTGIELTNMVSGHHASAMFKPAGEVRRYYSATRVDVTRVAADDIFKYVPGGENGDRHLRIVVKGSKDDMSEYRDLFLDELKEGDPLIEEFFGDRDQNPRFDNGRVTASIGERMESVRRGWNPAVPWTDDEARERARHYWPIDPYKVEALQEIAADDRLILSLLVKDPRAGQSALRYSWKVDPDGDWLDYGDRVGIPLGQTLDQDTDPYLGTTPHRDSDGKQLLAGLQNNPGYADFTGAEVSNVTDVSDTLDAADQAESETNEE